MKTRILVCFDCDAPLLAEALQWHSARCAACAVVDYEREASELVSDPDHKAEDKPERPRRKTAA